MSLRNLAPAALVARKRSGVAVSAEPKYFTQDIKESDAEQYEPQALPGQLKRRLKSRHLQMIAIGS